MTALFSKTIVLCLTFSLALYGCTSNTTENSLSNKINPDTSLSKTQQLNTNINPGKKSDLEKIYTQAIGDYIRHANKEYQLIFDTLYFGKHAQGQPDDFPDIALPTSIENTHIKLVTPEQGKKNQKERYSSFYINLIGWTNADNADFIFVTFSNGFAHQFDFFIEYNYDTIKKEFVIDTSRFENYRYKIK